MLTQLQIDNQIEFIDCPMSEWLRRSHPAQYGETFDWSANLIAKRFWAPEGGYILSSLREERLGEKGGAPFG